MVSTEQCTAALNTALQQYACNHLLCLCADVLPLCCMQKPPYQLHMLFKRQQLPPLLLMLLLTVLRECMGADTVRLFSRPFWEAVHWTHSRRGFFYQQVENAFYLVGG
jgi:hypothetical protein